MFDSHIAKCGGLVIFPLGGKNGELIFNLLLNNLLYYFFALAKQIQDLSVNLVNAFSLRC